MVFISSLMLKAKKETKLAVSRQSPKIFNSNRNGMVTFSKKQIQWVSVSCLWVACVIRRIGQINDLEDMLSRLTDQLKINLANYNNSSFDLSPKQFLDLSEFVSNFFRINSANDCNKRNLRH